ncbi:Hypothetical predicted protein [Xyrichtys novacula]|uniref:Uncharacterized protein n=1 Tax=Xyrichtys novacula TaxID=13765 RepID=A0AAV1H3D7_XYRNO|nr:Hypothetical predicted protein [Xyrichtys novacula]
MSCDSHVKLPSFIDLYEMDSVPVSRTSVAWGACRPLGLAKQTWHFGRISSLWSSAPPGPPENTDLTCFPSSGLQTEPNKYAAQCCQKTRHLTSLLQQPLTPAVCPSGRPAVTVPEFTGAFPAAPKGYFHSTVLHLRPHSSSPLGAPHSG